MVVRLISCYPYFLFNYEDYVVGTSNLNGTKENSAKAGDGLELPEKGWKRYDDTDSRIKYTILQYTENTGCCDEDTWV